MLDRSIIDKYAHFSILLLCVIGVVIFKIPHLDLPFFWDEAWVYAPAVKMMGEGFPSLMPDAIPPNYTRGHPLLFHFLASIWLKVFGSSNSSLHSFALCISVALLVIVYFFGKTIFNKNIAIAATVLLSVQAVFLAQASFLLPEMLLSVFVLLTIFCFLKELKTGYIISATALLLTKESGIILIASLGIWFLIDNIITKRKKLSVHALLINGIILLLPVLISCIYFFVQWRIYGWFFYPEHLGMIDLSYNNFIEKFRKVYNFIFEEQGRNVLTMVFLITFIVFFKHISFKWRIVFSFLMIACVKIFFGAWKLSPFFTLSICAIILVCLFYFIVYKRYIETQSISENSICVFFIFTLLFMIFSSINFLSNRYLLCLMPIFTLTILYFSFTSFYNNKWLFLIFMVAAIFLSTYKSLETKISGDDNLSFVKIIALEKQIVSYMEEQNLYLENIHAIFLDSYALTNQTAGFLSGDKFFQKVHEGLTDSTQYAIISNYQMDKLYDVIPSSSEFVEEKRFENDNFWVALFKRKKSPDNLGLFLSK